MRSAPTNQQVALDWRFRRAVQRVAVVDDVLADYATNWCRRPLRRREVLPLTSAVELPGVTWSIDGDVMVEFFPDDRGPGRLIVREIALTRLLRKRLRSRHVTIEYRNWPSSSDRDDCAGVGLEPL
jgi:hypothetical protein